MGIFEDAILRGGLEILRSLKTDLIDEEVETKARKAAPPSSAGIEVSPETSAPFVPQEIEPREVRLIQWSPQLAMKVSRLSLQTVSGPPHALDCLTVIDRLVGSEPQFVSSGELPAVVFAQHQPLKLLGHACAPGVVISLRVESYADQMVTLVRAVHRAVRA
mgnify:CR=1 FL=1